MRVRVCVCWATAFLIWGSLFQVYAEDPKQEALDLLAEARAEECRVCRERLQEKAFKILDHVYYPDLEIAADGACVFVKSDLENQLILTCRNEDKPEDPNYPMLTFLFHTQDKHLVGIDPKDYTPEGLAQSFIQAPPGARFTGAIRVLSYPYGDGDAFNFHPSANHLQIHCQLMEVKILAE
ncbi:hypothetical protein SAMN02745216_02719 [Desulfatibacillum alkenivorans DSM 16219]|jgi:hypothetical protein|uniref:Uncharacterized protein n=1 Tax=Desulfatibacillum alkenivorans DSM 16219 TaxID=1121393 RepID=A0A1M6P080_9BACT|nr:hypothetical protein [Desulfatibacillum alkenivorans]SHK01320.1 hypothetical protein SAMN02745216_02719 [Desulfatibacillum alkenivorans DSM 16219]